MDQHPLPPAERTPAPTPRRTRSTLAVCLVSALAIAAGTLGAGVYLNRDSQAWQRILGTEPVPETVFTPSDQLVPLLEAMPSAEVSKAANITPALRAEYTATHVMLTKHVGLLTPAALVPPAEPRATASEAPQAVPPAPSTAGAKTLAKELATAGVELVQAAVDAPGERARALSGAGFESIIQARNLLKATGATQAQLDALPAPKLDVAKPAAQAATDPAGLPDLMLSSCPLPAGSPAPVPAATANGKTPDALMPESGATLGLVADAAYRLGYAYDVAAARTSGTLRGKAAARSTALVELGSSIEAQYASVGDCTPLRQPAYVLPPDAAANPMDAAASGEEQLALLLRDAAATQKGDIRAFLLQEAWEQGLYARQVTGKIPQFTRIPADAGSQGPSGSPTPTP